MKREGRMRTLAAMVLGTSMLLLSAGCQGENAVPGPALPGQGAVSQPGPIDEPARASSADPDVQVGSKGQGPCGEGFVGRHVDGHCQPFLPLETQKDNPATEEFGAAMALSGELAVVGAPAGLDAQGRRSGAVYVFELSVSGIWTQVARLTPSDGRDGDRFGAAVAAQGVHILVGAPWHPTRRIQRAGGAYLFRRTEEGWQEEQALAAIDGPKDEQFGSAVAISPLALVVGAPLDDTPAGTDAGSAYVFERRGGALRNLTKLGARTGRAYDNFGATVAADGLHILVGAPGDDTAAANAGAAHLYARAADGLWEPLRISPTLPAANGMFGLALAMREDTLLIGAPGESAGERIRAGAAYVIERGTGRFDQVTRLLPQTPAERAGFGASVALGDALALIGAYADQGPEKGFVGAGVAIARRAATGWQLDGGLLGPQDQGLGRTIALSGTSALVGLSRGPLPGLEDDRLFIGSVD